MFFSIAPDVDTRFGINYRLNTGYFNCDPGWTSHTVNGIQVLFKGYVEGYSVDNLLTELVADPTPRHKGNFCLVVDAVDQTIVTHDRDRGFPLYYYVDDKRLTNLIIPDHETVYYYVVPGTKKSLEMTRLNSDHYACLDKNLYLQDRAFDCYGKIPDAVGHLDREQCATAIKDLMVSKINGIDLQGQTVKLFYSGGIDTSTVAALVLSQNIKSEIIQYEHFEYDDFTYHNILTVKNHHWAYSKIQHWLAPSVIAAGGCGDEFIMRGPLTAALWAAWHSIDIISMVEQPNDYYHGKYFLTDGPRREFKDAFDNRRTIQNTYPTVKDLNKQILNMLINDHQQWHMGNTLHLTLFKDIEITKLLLQARTEVVVEQILGAAVSFRIIEQLQPDILKYIAPFKNQNNLAAVGQAIFRR
jgi:hypothetical protein